MVMELRPAQTCCGVTSLLYGVVAVSVIHLVFCILLIASVDSTHNVRIGGTSFNTFVQIMVGAWSLLGIPIIFGAGVGAIYRIELHIRIYYYYYLATIIGTTFTAIYFSVTGTACATGIVSKEVQSMASGIYICSLLDVMNIFWFLINLIIQVYVLFCIWSFAEELKSAQFPHLVKYKNNLLHAGFKGKQMQANQMKMQQQQLLQQKQAASMAARNSANYGAIGMPVSVGQ